MLKPHVVPPSLNASVLNGISNSALQPETSPADPRRASKAPFWAKEVGLLVLWLWMRPMAPTISFGRNQPAWGRFDRSAADSVGIAFVRRPPEGPEPGFIYLVSPLGGPARKLSDFPTRGSLSWSADGRWLEDRVPVEPDAQLLPGAIIVRGERILLAIHRELATGNAIAEPAYG